MEGVFALAPHGRTVITGVFDTGTAGFIRHAANTTAVVFNAPLPHCNTVPPLHAHFDHPYVGA